MLRSGNPVLNDETFSTRNLSRTTYGDDSNVMTLHGTVNKTLLLLLAIMVSATYTWNLFFEGRTEVMGPIMIGGAIGGFVLGLVTTFKKNWAPITAPFYAVFEGLFLGALSATVETRYPGIVIQAVGLTFAVFLALLFAYKSQLIQATENFKLGLSAAMGGIFLLYLAQFVLSMFGVHIPYIHESGVIGIGFSLVVVVVAALSLVMNFDFIENGASTGAPKYMEWYSAFALMVTLIWLYIEMLHLLMKLNNRR